MLQQMEKTQSANTSSLSAFYQTALMQGVAVALWRLPESYDGSESAVQAIADFSGIARPVELDFRALTPGFLLSPFVSGEQHALHIAAHAQLKHNRLSFVDEATSQPRRAQFAATYHSLRNSHSDVPAHWYTPIQSQRAPIIGQRDYERLVNDAVEFILRSGVRKVVTSRVVENELPFGFDPVLIFERLCKRYAHAFVSLVAIPGVGTWIGATPETLVSIDENGVRTMALAGTQAKPTGLPLEEVGWGHKEIEEQAVVSRDIREFFQRAGVVDIEEKGPRTVAAGNVVHLQTLFRVSQPTAEQMQLANQILTVLHPTSAVCGMPKDRALSFINDNETHERSFYSGFLGPVQLDGRSDLFVNLRCMQLHADRAHLYVGGGITGESDPAAEWRETELKARTLLDVLK